MYHVFLRGPSIAGAIKVGSFAECDLYHAIEYSKLLLSAMKAGYYILVANESLDSEIIWDSRKEKE